MAFPVSRGTLNDETNCAFIFTVTITAATLFDWLKSLYKLISRDNFTRN